MKEIQLTQGKVAIVDDADYDWLSQFKWYTYKHRNTWYAVRNIPPTNGKRSKIKMHQVICEKNCDHKDGNGLNNQRTNLRAATASQNQHNRRISKNNTSGLKGVTLDKRRNKWMARIVFNGKSKFLGLFATRAEAGRAYDQAARELYGEFAALNFP